MREPHDYERADDDLRDEAFERLEMLEAEEDGTCDSCEAAMINGVRSHEHGCPRYARLRHARELCTRLENE